MPMSSIRKTVAVNGALLKDDRIAAGLSQEALLAGCDKAFHIGTLRRAEYGENISEIYLASLAKALGYSIERYLLADTPNSSAFSCIDISGEWIAHYVQDHAGSAPYVVTEATSFQQSDGHISGYSESEYRGKSVREVFTDLSIRGDMLIGRAIVEGWGDITGATSVQAVISRGNDWIDGYAMWYDSDSRDICCSRYIMIRVGASFEAAFSAEAKEIMAQECLRFAARRT